MAVSAQRAREILAGVVGKRALILGDLMLDVYRYGRTRRISPEAPVPVFEAMSSETRLGGAGNVARCLALLGARVSLAGVLGQDASGQTFLAEARSLGLATTWVLSEAGRPTTTKTRLVVRRQQLLRIDEERCAPPPPETAARLSETLRSAAECYDGVILSDYAKGVLAGSVCAGVAETAARIPVIVDPKGAHWDRYRGATLLTPNQEEAESVCGFAVDGDEAAGQAAEKIGRSFGVKLVLLTRGERGMTLWGDKEAPVHLPARAREVGDVTGAGDVVAAVAGACLMAGACCAEAAFLANVAAGVKVGKFGAQAVADHEILAELSGLRPAATAKVQALAEARRFADSVRTRGGRVVFTNGCFDLLHLGHVSYLEQARALGTALIVGINTDASVRRLKGPGRPLVPQQERARVIAALECVDAVVLFDEDTPLELVKQLHPDVLCKGADYRDKYVAGAEEVRAWGGRLVLIELVDDRSTSDLIRKMRRAPPG